MLVTATLTHTQWSIFRLGALPSLLRDDTTTLREWRKDIHSIHDPLTHIHLHLIKMLVIVAWNCIKL